MASNVGADWTNAVGMSVVKFAYNAIGTPYKWGGESPSGYDCSGLTQAAYKSVGINIPRTSEMQWAAGPTVQPPFIPGDLIFFGGNGFDGTPASPGHVGIYIGNNEMIDAPFAGARVRIDSINGYTGATRPQGGAGNATTYSSPQSSGAGCLTPMMILLLALILTLIGVM